MENPVILVVDGDPKNLKILQESLDSSGFTVLTAPDGMQAWKRAQADNVDIILSEVNLPGLDGFQLLEKLKEDPTTAAIPLMFLTNRRELQDRVRSLRGGVKDYMIKPLHVKEVIARIRMILRRTERVKKEDPENAKKLVGRLEEYSVVDLIENFGVERKSGQLHIYNEHNRNGEVFFNKGAVVHASLGTLKAEKAVYQMLPWRRGHFIMTFREVDAPNTISVSNLGLLLHGFKRMEQRERLFKQLPSPETTFVLTDTFRRIVERKELSPEAAKFIALIDGSRDIMQLIDASLYDDLKTLDRLVKLHQQNLIAPGKPAEHRPAAIKVSGADAESAEKHEGVSISKYLKPDHEEPFVPPSEPESPAAPKPPAIEIEPAETEPARQEIKSVPPAPPPDLEIDEEKTEELPAYTPEQQFNRVDLVPPKPPVPEKDDFVIEEQEPQALDSIAVPEPEELPAEPEPQKPDVAAPIETPAPEPPAAEPAAVEPASPEPPRNGDIRSEHPPAAPDALESAPPIAPEPVSHLDFRPEADLLEALGRALPPTPEPVHEPEPEPVPEAEAPVAHGAPDLDDIVIPASPETQPDLPDEPSNDSAEVHPPEAPAIEEPPVQEDAPAGNGEERQEPETSGKRERYSFPLRSYGKPGPERHRETPAPTNGPTEMSTPPAAERESVPEAAADADPVPAEEPPVQEEPAIPAGDENADILVGEIEPPEETQIEPETAREADEPGFTDLEHLGAPEAEVALPAETEPEVEPAYEPQPLGPPLHEPDPEPEPEAVPAAPTEAEQLEGLLAAAARSTAVQPGKLVVIGTNPAHLQTTGRFLMQGADLRRVDSDIFAYLAFGERAVPPAGKIGFVAVSMEQQFTRLLEKVSESMAACAIIIEATGRDRLAYLGYLLKAFREKFPCPLAIGVVAGKKRSLAVDTIRDLIDAEADELVEKIDPADPSSLLAFFTTFLEKQGQAADE